MESSRSEDCFGVLVEKIGLTIWCPDFCDGHRTELCSIAETLSYTLDFSVEICVAGCQGWGYCGRSSYLAPPSLGHPPLPPLLPYFPLCAQHHSALFCF